jgi:hypothetical protein
MAAYCVYADLVPFLPSGGLPNPARTATGRSSTNAIESEGHGLALERRGHLRGRDRRRAPGTSRRGHDLLRDPAQPLALLRVGDLGRDGGQPHHRRRELRVRGRAPVGAVDGVGRAPDRRFLLPAHVVPVVPDTGGAYPPVIVIANAEIAATLGLSKTGGADDRPRREDRVDPHPAQGLGEEPARFAASRRRRTSPVNLAITSTAGAADPRGWATCGNDRIP